MTRTKLLYNSILVNIDANELKMAQELGTVLNAFHRFSNLFLINSQGVKYITLILQRRKMNLSKFIYQK